MIRHASLNDARKFVLRWSDNAESVEHIGDRGNSVFSFKNAQGNLQILRFTDPDFRSFDELLGELAFVNHLHATDVPVAKALPTDDGQLAFLADCESGDLICSSIAYAQGLEIQEDSRHWNKDFFKEWGRNLGLIHQASMQFEPSSGFRRWSWEEEILIARAEQLIPVEDRASLEEFHEVMDLCRHLPKSPSEFGLIHADHAPQNFRYDPEMGRITAFDFGNCCYHWFISDVAIALSTVRRKPNREEIREGILDGYSTVRSLPSSYEELIDPFIRLRVVYVYLSRLHFWSVNRTPAQAKEIEVLRDRVHSKTGWEIFGNGG
ncbi:MAG: phosphotransferase [Bdellovibrionaceae bacterium]|nr:phosphotransferase [Pseudobdellovibrionaceae bacterium]